MGRGREGLEGRITKDTGTFLEVLDVFTILIVVMVSQVCTNVKTYTLYTFKYVPLVKTTSIKLFKKNKTQNSTGMLKKL